MKTILIATDFSHASRNASLYGVAFAKEVNAKVILFNAYKIAYPPAALNMCISRYDIMMQIDKRLIDEADFLDPKGDLIEVMCDEGVPEDAIISIANEKKADFIIAGMKGSGKSLTRIFGSTATALAKHTNIPLIIIPEDALYKSPQNIVFANDSLHANEQLPELLTKLADVFKSVVYEVHVVKEKNKEFFKIAKTQKLRGIMGDSYSSYQVPVDTDIRHTLRAFMQTHNTDMLVMIPHKHEWLERMFIKSESKDMIFHTHIPLLVLPDMKPKNYQVPQMETTAHA